MACTDEIKTERDSRRCGTQSKDKERKGGTRNVLEMCIAVQFAFPGKAAQIISGESGRRRERGMDDRKWKSLCNAGHRMTQAVLEYRQDLLSSFLCLTFPVLSSSTLCLFFFFCCHSSLLAWHRPVVSSGRRSRGAGGGDV